MAVLNCLPGMSVLIAFETTVRLGTISAAARKLGVTTSAISRSINELEKQIGCKLFARHGRSLTPLPRAITLSQRISSNLESICEAIKETKREVRNRPLVLSCEPTLLVRWLIPRLVSLQKMLGDNEVQLVSAGGEVDFNRDGIDYALRRNDFAINENLAKAVFMREKIGPVCKPELVERFIKNGIIVGPLLHTATRPNAWDKWTELTGNIITAKQQVNFEHFYQSIQAAGAGAGIAISPISLSADEISSGTLAAPMGFLEDGTEYVLISQKDKGNSPIFLALRDWLISAGKKTVIKELNYPNG
ncbi:LysR family transcriptional regulator [Serratia marcescens]|nr:LysR family transcriptional regulator [Serratia marcescens]MBN5204533.1 LysR family transcriptional regulator [Serratia marcescens]